MIEERINNTELIPIEKAQRAISEESEEKIEMAGYIFNVLLLLLIIGVGIVIILIQSYKFKIQGMANNAMPELWKAEDGTYELSWRGLEDIGADFYHVNVSTYTLGGGNEQKTVFSGYVDGVSCKLPALSADETFVLQIDLIRKKSVLGKECIWQPASVRRFFHIQNPAVNNFDYKVDSDTVTAYFSFDFQKSNCCGIYVTEQDGSKKFLKLVDENSVELCFKEEAALWVPVPGNPCTLTFAPGSCANDMILYGDETKEITVAWEDFAACDIHPALDIIDGCVCRLEWDELNCDSYEIQMMEADVGVWKTVKTVANNAERIYISHRLNPGVDYSFRVAAVMGDYTAVSEACKCEIAVTPIYCTVWPVKDLTVYSDAAKSEVAGKVKALDAYCVVAVKDDMFGINMEDRVLFIDSNYCMINLTEYVGTLCSYDITNSYDSIFMAHGFEIPGLTGETIVGYEDVWLSDGSFLVPLLYPTAQKLETAIETARQKGYRLKIYDAFRPQRSSVDMYRKATAVQYTTLPESTYWGVELRVPLYVQETDENGVITERRKTYWELMNDVHNSFTMSAFVSGGISSHSLGIAIDLTLEHLDSGIELPMQTELHDLSQYSARANNNVYAKDLSEIMMSSGYTDLYSEWWHFQDNETRNKISPPSVYEGVSPECWMTNGYGWRYRDIYGNFAEDCTLNINGKEYTFDSDGYVQR